MNVKAIASLADFKSRKLAFQRPVLVGYGYIDQRVVVSLRYSIVLVCLLKNISQTLQVNNSGILTIKNAKISGIIFIGTLTYRESFKSALVYL